MLVKLSSFTTKTNALLFILVETSLFSIDWLWFKVYEKTNVSVSFQKNKIWNSLYQKKKKPEQHMLTISATKRKSNYK